MSDEAIETDILAALEMVALERLEDGRFKLVTVPPTWFGHFHSYPDAGTTLRVQETFLFLEHFLSEADTFWQSGNTQPLRSGVWTEAYASGRQYSLEASALRMGKRRLLVIERLRSTFGDIQALTQKSRDRNLDYDRLRQTEKRFAKVRSDIRPLRKRNDLIQSCSPRRQADLCKSRAGGKRWATARKKFPGCRSSTSSIQAAEPIVRRCSGALCPARRSIRSSHVVTKDGKTIAVEGNSSCRFKDGKPVATRSIFRDITDRKRAAHSLKKSEQQLQAILDNSTAVIYLKDFWGRYILVNSRFETLFHVSKAQVVGKTDFDFFPRELAEVFQANDRKVLETRAALESEETRASRRRASPYLSVKFPICDSNGEPYAICGISTDITDRKRMEADLAEARDAALESARLKAEFLANMSHEIRTPINAVIGMTGLLLDTKLSAEQRDYAETVRSSADALLTIINDILDFSKIEAGKLTFETMDFDLPTAVEGAVELLAEAAQSKRVELFSRCMAMSRPRCAATRAAAPGAYKPVEQRSQVHRDREVIVRVSERARPPTRAVRFAVTDTGIGIAEDVRQRILKHSRRPTVRQHASRAERVWDWRSLSSLSRDGGEIGVNSTPGRGSTFWFTARFDRQPQTTPELTEKARFEGLRVLVVDDNATNRSLVHHQITSWGLRNGSAASGAEALHQLRREAAAGDAYDIAVLDMQMPEMDGLMLAREIKADESIAGTRLLMMTSLGPRDDDLLSEAGIEVCLRKPVKQSQLYNGLAALTASGSHETQLAHAAAPGIAVGQDEPGCRPGFAHFEYWLPKTMS